MECFITTSSVVVQLYTRTFHTEPVLQGYVLVGPTGAEPVLQGYVLVGPTGARACVLGLPVPVHVPLGTGKAVRGERERKYIATSTCTLSLVHEHGTRK